MISLLCKKLLSGLKGARGVDEAVVVVIEDCFKAGLGLRGASVSARFAGTRKLKWGSYGVAHPTVENPAPAPATLLLHSTTVCRRLLWT